METLKVVSMNPVENSNEKFGSSHVQFRYSGRPLQSVH
jgi:hypothetical protein